MTGRLRQLLALPSVGWTILFFLAPLGLLLVYSFGSVNLLTFKVEFGWTLSNYSDIFQKLYLEPVLRSFAVSAASTLACLVIGFPVALHDRPGARPPSGAAAARGDDPLLDELRGAHVRHLQRDRRQRTALPPAARARSRARLHPCPVHAVGVGSGIVYTYLPLMILPLYVALERIDPALLEAASDLGAPAVAMSAQGHAAAGSAGDHRRLHPGGDPRDRRVRRSRRSSAAARP